MASASLPAATGPRRGVILLVVLILLTLFAVVGLSFALYAGGQAQASRLYREAEAQQQPDADPEMLFAYFLGQFLYDTDDFTGVYSALRGHSLARNMYGYNYKRNGSDLAFVCPNTVPFNGLGRLHNNPPIPNPTNPFGADDYNLINYTFFRTDGFFRDPERRDANPPRTDVGQFPGDYLGGFNAPYTYPDLNSMFLGAVKAGPLTDAAGNILAPPGSVLMPSFHRPWLFGRLTDPGNPNWTRAMGKYLTLRPRPVDMSSRFPYPEDEGGDVKNLAGSPGYFDPVTGKLCNNDSIWIDLDFPVMTAPDGRSYKPLFAPLVIDLDNRVNVNVHGNIRGRDQDNKRIHLSNQGWGPWEVSLSQVLDGDPQEWTNLFGGLKNPNSSPGEQVLLQRGRYGVLDDNHQPSSPRPHAPWFPNMSLLPHRPSPFYSPVDFDAASDLYGPSSPIRLPGEGDRFWKPICFPSYAPEDYQGNTVTERTDHPSLYNYFQPAPDDRQRFLSSNMEALLRHGDTGSPALTSELFRLCPMNFSGPGSDRRRHLVTTRSFDVDRPGVMPWATPGTYRMGPGYEVAYPEGAPEFVAPHTNKGEYGPDGRGNDASYGRVNLNRDLPTYPKPTPGSGRIDTSDPATLAQFKRAQWARAQLAKEVLDRLRLATSGSLADPSPPTASQDDPQTQEFDAQRWLAQVAVNIVDFLDSDDYMTPFNWYPKPYPGHPTGDWVYGTELPRLVLNEAYIEYISDPDDIGGVNQIALKNHWVNFWVELYNPFHKDPQLPDSVYPSDPNLFGAARLMTPGSDPYAVYRLQIAKTADPHETLLRRDNTQGLPDPALVVRTVSDFSSADNNVTCIVLASDPEKYGGEPGKNVNGFYVLGPKLPPYAPGFGELGPNFETLRVENMTYRLNKILKPTELARLPLHDLFLQRLACPHLPPNPDPTSPTYNPYITVDYMDAVQANDGAKRADDEFSGHKPPRFTQRFSCGRRQPYAAHSTQRKKQTPIPPLHNQPQNTFFRHNSDTRTFDWLIHLDRPLISTMELLNVSAFKPHELTHQFVRDDQLGNSLFRHRLGEIGTPGLFRRVFEFLGTGERALGTAPGGRVPGKVNINTVWDPETLAAICDPQPANGFASFNPHLVQTLFTKLRHARTPSGTFDARDQPFRGMATAFELTAPDDPNGASWRERLIFNLLIDSTQHPFLQEELLNKIYNHLTARSNVFAVWLTVGFFEVVQDRDAVGNPIRPVKLGAEIGRAENRHIRHRMFAIVDRTNLTTLANVTRLSEGIAGGLDPQAGRSQTVAIEALAGTTTSPPFPVSWRIKVGSSLTIEDPANPETVMVTSVDPNKREFSAVFKASHPKSTRVSFADTPGPPPIFLSSLSLDSFSGVYDTARPTHVPIVARFDNATRALFGSYEDLAWFIRRGDWLVVDSGPNEEAVQVLRVNAVYPDGLPSDPVKPPSFQARFTKPHASPLTIRFPNAKPGNPGPQSRFNPCDRVSASIVRHLSIVE